MPPESLADGAAGLRTWLLDAALPLWRGRGVDAEAGVFEEALAQDGSPLDRPLRLRVQARQAFVFASAGALGWDGDWRGAVRLGLAAIQRAYRRPDGLYRFSATREGRPAQDQAALYEQAFTLLAYAHATGSGVADRRAEALALLERVCATFRHEGGFREEDPDQPFQANANMHLLEAALAWTEVDGDPRWPALADAIAEFCLARLIDPESGALLEAFDAHWRPLAGPAQRVEPGHQFEWAWLLERWSRRHGRPEAHAAAHAAAAGLFEVGEGRGVDPARSLAVDELGADLTLRSSRARLWPQTERIKAAVLLAERADGAERAAYSASAADACAGLGAYLRTPVPGLFWDKCEADGAMAAEPAPATSLYHIVGAVAELHRTLGDPR